MPTILRIGKFAFRLYPNDHSPAHVHVITSGGEVMVRLKPRVVLLDVYGMKKTDIADALRLVKQHQALLLDAWRKMHGHQDNRFRP
jgi:hypothetical protein